MTHEPRSSVITRHAEAALRTTGLPFNALADRAVTLYHERTALHERALQFQVATTAQAYEQVSRANAQQVRRMMDGTVRMPADFEEALVLAVPELQRSALLRELAARYGLLAAPLPATGGSDASSIAALMHDSARLLQALAPAFADGILDARDIAEAKAARPLATDLQGRLVSLTAELDEILRARRAQLRSVGK